MNKNAQKGRASLAFCHPVFLLSSASIVGKKEGEGPLGSFFDQVCEDPFFGADTWEAAESSMQKETALLAIKKAGLIPSDLRIPPAILPARKKNFDFLCPMAASVPCLPPGLSLEAEPVSLAPPLLLFLRFPAPHPLEKAPAAWGLPASP